MNQHLKLHSMDRIAPLSAEGAPDRTVAIVDRGVTSQLISASSAKPLIRRIWPLATIIFGLALTVAWMSVLGYLLGYALVVLIGLAM